MHIISLTWIVVAQVSRNWFGIWVGENFPIYTHAHIHIFTPFFQILMHASFEAIYTRWGLSK